MFSGRGAFAIRGRRTGWTALIGVGFLTGALFGPSLATAAEKITDVFVTNTASDPVPVHEQGTATVALQPVTGGSGSVVISTGDTQGFSTPQVASAISIHLAGDVGWLRIRNGTHLGLRFYGPGQGGNSTVVLALTRPLQFDFFECDGPGVGTCNITWIGNEP